MQINQTTISSAAFNHDCSMLVTVGTDHYNRVQIVVWNINVLLQRKSIVLDSSTDMLHKNITDSGRAFAKQLSDFPISSIAFSSFEDNCLVSCGRENIRFWRLRKKHLPGRPVLLGQFSRGFIFHDLSFFNCPGIDAADQRRPCVFVSSNKGIILKIDYMKENIIFAYHLHQASITSFTIRNGLAFTGSSDCTLRVWPLDFSDFLMEAQFEGSVTAIKIDTEGVNMLVGTSSGTIGILKVQEQHYKTLLRSHTAAIYQMAKRNHGEEFVTVSADKTIRIWDLFSCQQKFEFSSVVDEPLSIDYHPTENVIVCGFESGYVRIFDIDTTSTSNELKHLKSHVCFVKYVSQKINADDESSSKSIHLVTISTDGIMIVYNAVNYNPVKSLSLSLSKDYRLFRFAYLESENIFACCTGYMSSLVVMNMNDYNFIIRDGQHLVDFPIHNSQKIDAPKSPSVSKGLRELFENSSNMIIKGLGFCCKGGSINLIIAQDNSLIQIHFPNDVFDQMLNTVNVSLPSVSTKKIDFGIIENFFLDSVSGMAVVAISALSSSKASTSKVSFAIFQIQSDNVGKCSKLRVSSAQLYDDHFGDISSIIFCLKHGKLISSDNNGSVIVWNLATDRSDKLLYFSSPDQDTLLYDIDNGTRRVQINDNVDICDTNPMNISGSDSIDNAKIMLNDFENAVSHDPSMWSAGTIDTASPSHYEMSEAFSGDVDDFIPSPSFAVKSSNTKSVRLEDMFITDDQYVSPERGNIVDHKIIDNQYLDEVNIHAIEDGLISAVDESNEETITNELLEIPSDAKQVESPIFSKEPDEMFGLGNSVDNNNSGFQFMSTLNIVPPLYNARFREIIFSDGSMVILLIVFVQLSFTLFSLGNGQKY